MNSKRASIIIYFIMSVSGTKEFAVELFVNQLTNKLSVENINMDLLNKIVSKLAPVSYDTEADSAYVSGNDQTEIDTVVKSLFVKHLGHDESHPDHEVMVRAAIEKYGTSNPKKYRVPLIYIILADNNLVDDYLAL